MCQGIVVAFVLGNFKLPLNSPLSGKKEFEIEFENLQCVILDMELLQESKNILKGFKVNKKSVAPLDFLMLIHIIWA